MKMLALLILLNIIELLTLKLGFLTTNELFVIIFVLQLKASKQRMEIPDCLGCV